MQEGVEFLDEAAGGGGTGERLGGLASRVPREEKRTLPKDHRPCRSKRADSGRA